eukprot:GEMP01121827.1.p1 GENE.GEMP01121827.1~~GEMP01121827.1.p1  ORF type:complete len:108 (-),score=5.34 GEMP01121827.1:89-412(-)
MERARGGRGAKKKTPWPSANPPPPLRKIKNKNKTENKDKEGVICKNNEICIPLTLFRTQYSCYYFVPDHIIKLVANKINRVCHLFTICLPDGGASRSGHFQKTKNPH